MKTITVRLPEALAAEIEAESEDAGISKSDVIRRRLEQPRSPRSGARRPLTLFEAASDLIGSVDDPALPVSLSSRKKQHLQSRGYGRKHPR